MLADCLVGYTTTSSLRCFLFVVICRNIVNNEVLVDDNNDDDTFKINILTRDKFKFFVYVYLCKCLDDAYDDCISFSIFCYNFRNFINFLNVLDNINSLFFVNYANAKHL